MVKVQKPTPKTFSKVSPADNPMKKKKLDIKKAAKASAVVIPDVSPPSKKDPKKLIKETAIEAKIVQKPEIKPELKKSKGKTIAEADKSTKEAKSKHRPLVLAPPPESPKPAPAAPTPIPTGGEPKIANGKTLKTVTPAVASSAFEKKKQHNLKKSADATKSLATVKGPNRPAALTGAQKKNAFIKGNQKQEKDVHEPELTKAQKKKLFIKAYQKQQKIQGLKEKAARSITLEPVSFDEKKFHSIVNEKNVKNIAEALKVQCEKQHAEKKTSIFTDYRYNLNVVCFKIPSCARRIVKLSLKHSLVDKDDDVAIVVKDLKRGAKVDYEPTIQHYEDVFREAGVEGLKIVPFNQLRTECTTFEAVRKFGNTYDYFLCDGRLVKAVAGFTGNIFQKPRTTFHAVRMDNPKDIKVEIKKSLSRTAYRRLTKGDVISIPVGSHKHTMQQLSENVIHVVQQLQNSNAYPGGFANIRAMYLKTNIVSTPSLPLYISMAQPPAEVPYVVGEREYRMLKMKKDANEFLTKFVMTKDAQIIKLSKDQVERKRQVKEAKAALAVKIDTPEEDGDDDDKETLPAKKVKKVEKVEAPQDDDDDGEVPAKKAKKEQKAEVEKDSKKKQVEEQAEPEDEDDDDDADNDSDDEEGDDADDGEDDDDDDDGEGNGDVDEGDDDDDDEDDADDDDDDEGEDDEDGDDNEDSD